MILGIIPARGGSKRIPNKNIKEFAGRPIISYSIRAALSSKVFDRVIVSTDSERISEVSRRYRAEAPFVRPPDLSNDTARTEDVLIHAIDWYEQRGQRIQYACCIFATAPFIRAMDLAHGLELLKSSGATVAFSVTSFAYPIFRALRIRKNGLLKMLWPKYMKSRSNDLPEAVHDAGQFYWLNVKQFRQEKEFFCGKSVPVYLPRYLVQDIDTLEDWKTAEYLWRAVVKRK